MLETKVRELEMLPKMAEIEQMQEVWVGGETRINEEVIGAIAGVAAREIAGVSSLGTRSIRRTVAERVAGTEKRARGVEVEAGRREAIVDIELRVVYGFSIPEAVISVRRNVAGQAE